MKRTLLPALLVSSALVLAGCYGAPAEPSETPSPTSTAADTATAAPVATSAAAAPAATDLAFPGACDVLDAATIASVAGGEWSEGEVNTDLSTEYQTICEWYKANAQFTFVQVLVTNDPAAVATQRANANETLGDAADATVAGASDAYTVGGGTIIGMVAGDHFVQVTFLSNGSPDGPAGNLALAEIVAAAIG